MRLILARDRVNLRTPQPLAERPGGEPGGLIPAGVIGEVITVGPTGALVRWSGKYPPISVNLRDLVHAPLFDLLPVAMQQLGRWVGHRLYVALGLMATVAISAVLTLEIQRHLGKCGP
jgi:hypothetical protein